MPYCAILITLFVCQSGMFDGLLLELALRQPFKTITCSGYGYSQGTFRNYAADSVFLKT